jgi:hypothetical protein
MGKKRVEPRDLRAGLALFALLWFCGYSAISLCLSIPDNDAVAAEDMADDAIQGWGLPSLDKKFTALFCLGTSAAVLVVAVCKSTYTPPLIRTMLRDLVRTDRCGRGPPGYSTVY